MTCIFEIFYYQKSIILQAIYRYRHYYSKRIFFPLILLFYYNSKELSLPFLPGIESY
jgi:hypothetical protein